MSITVESLLGESWERFVVPDTNVSAEFPSEPAIDEGDDADYEDEDDDSVALSLDLEWAAGEVRFDLAVSAGQPLEDLSSEDLAEQLREELRANEDLQLLSVEPRGFDGHAGVVQRLKLKATGETLVQWLIPSEEVTIFAGVTFSGKCFDSVTEKFFASVSVGAEVQEG